MIMCPFCQANNLENANFCSNCGKSLSEGVSLEDNPLADSLLETDAVDINRETDPVAVDTMAALAQPGFG